jgi:hypothetical protein
MTMRLQDAGYDGRTDHICQALRGTVSFPFRPGEEQDHCAKNE